MRLRSPIFTEYHTPGEWAGARLCEIEAVSPDMPRIIEPLETESEYDTAARYIRGVAAQEGIGIK